MLLFILNDANNLNWPKLCMQVHVKLFPVESLLWSKLSFARIYLVVHQLCVHCAAFSQDCTNQNCLSNSLCVFKSTLQSEAVWQWERVLNFGALVLIVAKSGIFRDGIFILRNVRWSFLFLPLLHLSLACREALVQRMK